MRNPFTPNFGQVPPHMAGRSMLIEELLNALESGSGDPNLSSIFVGPRGSGKTSMMSYIAAEAEGFGWISVNVTALPGMLEDLLEQSVRKGAHLIEPKSRGRLTGLSLAQLLGLEWEYPDDSPLPVWRSRMTDVLEVLDDCGCGILITVDEVDPKLDEMIQLASVYQHFVREGRKVALLISGLPHRVSGLLSDGTVSFLRRSAQHRLDPVPDDEAATAIFRTAEDGGKLIGPEALEIAAKAAEGSPYMIQLVGFRSWEASGSKEAIDAGDVEKGVELARRDFKERVLDATLDGLSDGDLAFLGAMIAEGETSSLSRLAERLGKGSSYISTYRKRLLEQGVITRAGRNKVKFALPMLGGYLPEYLDENY